MATRSKLYGDQRGAIACETHAPYKGSDTWVWDRWQEMPEAEQKAFRTMVDLGPEEPLCETCRYHPDRQVKV